MQHAKGKANAVVVCCCGICKSVLVKVGPTLVGGEC